MNKISRRNFIRGIGSQRSGAAAAGALSGLLQQRSQQRRRFLRGKLCRCLEQPAAAASAITWDDIFATSYSQANRRSNPDAKAPETRKSTLSRRATATSWAP